MIKSNVKYEQIMPIEFTEELLSECSVLYSNHYGRWSSKNPNFALKGKNIRLSVDRIREWFDNQNSNLYVAKVDERIIGYAIAARIKVAYWGYISWVTQLVVHTEFRNQDIAKQLLYSIWCESSNFAWGIVSANPYAIRALEKATRRRSSPKIIKKHIQKLIEIGNENLPYIQSNTDYIVDNSSSIINTDFFVDHTNIPAMLSRVITDEVPWLLGDLIEGWEWIAFTFKSQQQLHLSDSEIAELLNTSDMVNMQAYSRMRISDDQTWMNNTESEVDFIINECNLKEGNTVLDFGCGTGRHSRLLAKKGISVVGIDYVKNNIEYAKAHAKEMNNLSFQHGDCRSFQFFKKVQAVICLYDVIGSFVDENENIRIIKNIANALESGGIALISVMNYELTRSMAKHLFKFSENPNAILNLPTSGIMENTGNIFDPDYYFIDEDTEIVYRKERFDQGNNLPVELIVRDKRYTMDEITLLCERNGLHVEFSRYVNAKDWKSGYESTNKSAKEILLKCIKI